MFSIVFVVFFVWKMVDRILVFSVSVIFYNLVVGGDILCCCFLVVE